MAKRAGALVVVAPMVLAGTVFAQGTRQPDWPKLEAEMMQHYQALLRFDTSNPPGNEQPAADYVKPVFDREGIPAQIFALEPNRSNVVARLKGNGKKKPLLIMGHSDVVNVDPRKWKFPPFSATRDGGYVYGRGTVDDKDNLTAAPDGDAGAEAAQRAARPRRDLPVGGGRRGHDPRRHPVHGRTSTIRRSTPSTASPRAAASRASAAR